MKPARTLLLLFIGIILGIVATIGIQQFRHAQAMRLLPSLTDRMHPPCPDEFPGVTLSRRDGRLNFDIRDGMGGQHKDIQSLRELERRFSDGDPIWTIQFEPGVSSGDLEETVKTLSQLGVKRYFIGYSIYGKTVLH